MLAPPFIANTPDSNSADHLRNCMAWHLVTKRDRAAIDEHLKNKPADIAGDLRVRILRCLAWQWLREKSSSQIRHDLTRYQPACDIRDLRLALNELRHHLNT